MTNKDEELKTLKDLERHYDDFDDEYINNLKDLRFINLKELKAEAVKIIKYLKTLNIPQCDDSNAEKWNERFKEKFGFYLTLDDEYNWGDEQIETLIKFIMWQNNLTEEDLK